MLTPPGAFVPTLSVPGVEPALTDALGGDKEIQLRVGIGLVRLLPRRSITVGVMKIPPVLLATAKVVLVAAFPTCRLIDCTRQVSK